MKSTQNKKTATKMAEPDNDDPIKPHDQLVLSTEELDEQYGNILNMNEPSKLQAQVVYSIKNKKFMPKVDRATFTTLINLKSASLLMDSAEAQVQMSNELCRTPEVIKMKGNETMVKDVDEDQQEISMDFENNTMNEDLMSPEEEVSEEFGIDGVETIKEKSAVDKDDVLSTERNEDAPRQEEEPDGVSEHSIESLPLKNYCAVVKLRNKFSFFDRYTMTKNIDMIDNLTQTTKAEKADLNVLVSLSHIYNAYKENMAIQEAEKEKEMKKKMAVSNMSKKRNADNVKNYGIIYDQRINVIKTLERIFSFDETEAIAQDFRYYEDQSDEFRGKGEGTLMMMWSMVFKNVNPLIVTHISWNPDYFDMFGITLSTPLNTMSKIDGSDVGYVCIWSLKNFSYPQIINQTHAGATCLSFHRDNGYIYAVGLRDGSLAVYNMSILTDKPQYKTEVNSTKHIGCVRQVVWRENLSTGEFNFYSISDDGTVCQWILLQSEMIKIVKISLTIDMRPELELGGLKQTYNAIGTTITFNPKNPEIFLIGTNEGYIFKCNTEWCNYVQRFRAHNLKVNQIDYNKFDPNIYVTCSEDFTVKLWDDTSEAPLLLINLNTSLSDVRWSPFSSTVFCVITENCRAIFFDLDVNMKKPVCDQLVQSPKSNHQLYRLIFDRRVPMILIGSFNGTVISLKLSPNLRTMMKSPKKGIQVPTETLEFEKLQTVLESIREDID